MAIRLPTSVPVLEFTNTANTKPGMSCRLSTCTHVRAVLQNHSRFVVSDDHKSISPKLKEDYVYGAKVATQPPTNVIPALDLTNTAHLKPGTSSRLSACRDVRDALEEHGCFLVSYDKISPNLKEDVYRAIKDLFDVPTEKRHEYNLGKPALCHLLSPRDPLFESMNILDTRTVETVEDFVNFVLPTPNEQYGKILDYYRKQVEELQEIVMRMVFESYGVEKYFDSHKESTVYIFRANKYKVPDMDMENAGLGLSVHTDLTFITILSSTQAQGLEIKGKDGKWFPLYCPPSSFVVMTGDAMQAWSNGRIRACLHRVTMTAKEERYSIGIFFMRNGTVAAPQELVGDAYPLVYKPFQHFGLLSYAMSDGADLVGADKLEAYCGSTAV